MCRTPLGLPVLPEVYKRNKGSSASIHSTCRKAMPSEATLSQQCLAKFAGYVSNGCLSLCIDGQNSACVREMA